MHLPFFQNIYNSPSLTRKDLERIAKAHVPVRFNKGGLIWRKGLFTNEYYLVEKGLFRSSVLDYKGRDITTSFIGENEIIIEASSLFQRIPIQENVEALTDALLWKIDFGDFQGLYHDIDAFNEWGRGWMSNQLFACKQRSVDMLTLSATERYLRLMKQRPDIFSLAPLKHVASYLGVTDTSLSRIRKEIVTKS